MKENSWGVVTVPITTKDNKEYALVMRSDGPTLMLSVTEDGGIIPVSGWAANLDNIRQDVTGQFAYFSSSNELWSMLLDLIVFAEDLDLFEEGESDEETSDSDDYLGD